MTRVDGIQSEAARERKTRFTNGEEEEMHLTNVVPFLVVCIHEGDLDIRIIQYL